jgi:hypothetical protein
MPLGVKVYTIKDFIRKTESGAIDFERSIRIVRELAMAAAFHEDHNILVDLRETYLAPGNMGDLMNIAVEVAQYRDFFSNKIACVIPDEPERIETAKRLEAALAVKDFQYRVFTSFEEAIEWLSDVQRGKL